MIRQLLALCTAFSISFSVWGANEQYLADRHSAMKLPCEACHTTKPQPGAMVSNEKCLSCHGPISKLQARYADKKEYNPHKNHLGDIECTICHKGHMKSQAYCEECHQDFKMPMK